MATRATKPKKPKLTRAEKKAARAARRSSRRESYRQLWQAFTLTRQADKKLIPYLVLSFVVVAALVYVGLFFLFGHSIWAPILIAVLLGLLAAFIVFGRRAQAAMYAQADGQPGAAGYLLQSQLKGDWRTTLSIAGTAQLDAVHRLVGRPGVVLVGEGSPARVRPLIVAEKRKLSRLTGQTPIYDIIVGSGEDEVTLAKLQMHVRKLPPNLTRDQVAELDKRLAAMSAARPPLPQGPMPTGAKMRSMQRTARRRSAG